MGLDADYAAVCMYHCIIMPDKKTMGFFEVAIGVVHARQSRHAMSQYTTSVHTEAELRSVFKSDDM